MYPKPIRIEALENIARTMVGDGGRPDLFIVCDRGVVVTITRQFDIAYHHWQELAERMPLVESSIENRRYGVIASVEPIDDDSPKLVVRDDSHSFLSR
jgi:hypothetical protein